MTLSSSSINPCPWYLGAHGLQVAPDDACERAVRSDETSGSDAGSWIGWGRPTDGQPDQRGEDAIALCFDSPPLQEGFEILGLPVVRLRLAADRSNAVVCLRLCDVREDGASLLISRGFLNLTRREGHDRVAALAAGRRYDVRVALKAVGHRFEAGHRLRLAVSAAYWPWIWPSPEPVTLTVVCGEQSRLELPVRAKLTRSARIRSAVTSAFAQKYTTPASRKWVEGFAEDARELTTFEFVPR